MLFIIFVFAITLQRKQEKPKRRGKASIPYIMYIFHNIIDIGCAPVHDNGCLLLDGIGCEDADDIGCELDHAIGCEQFVRIAG